MSENEASSNISITPSIHCLKCYVNNIKAIYKMSNILALKMGRCGKKQLQLLKTTPTI